MFQMALLGVKFPCKPCVLVVEMRVHVLKRVTTVKCGKDKHSNPFNGSSCTDVQDVRLWVSRLGQ